MAPAQVRSPRAREPPPVTRQCGPAYLRRCFPFDRFVRGCPMARFSVVSVVAAVALLTGCGGAAPGPGDYQNDFKTSAQFFTQMSKAVDNSGLDASKYVHKLQRTWFSSNVKGALSGTSLDLPTGTVAIKETYDGSGAPMAHLVMVKKSKDTWHYEVRKASDGAVDASAPSGNNAAMCFGCHAAFKDKDYLGGTAITN